MQRIRPCHCYRATHKSPTSIQSLKYASKKGAFLGNSASRPQTKQGDWQYSVTFYFIYNCFSEQESDGDIDFKRIISMIILTRELINHWHLSKKKKMTLEFYYFIISIMKRSCLPSLAINQASGMHSKVKKLNLKPEGIWFFWNMLFCLFDGCHILFFNSWVFICVFEIIPSKRQKIRNIKEKWFTYS